MYNKVQWSLKISRGKIESHFSKHGTIFQFTRYLLHAHGWWHLDHRWSWDEKHIM